MLIDGLEESGLDLTGATSEAKLHLKGDSGSEFRIIVRRLDINPLNFSLILVYKEYP